MEHRIVLGGEIWLPFARGRIKALKALGLPYASQKFEMPDGAAVRVRLAGEHEYIELTGGGEGYQFFSTGTSVLTEPYLGFPAYKGYAVVAGKGKSDAQGKPSPKAKVQGSSVEAGPKDPAGKPKWPLVDLLKITDSFPVRNVWQIQGIPEHTYYARAAGTAGVGAKLGTRRLVDSWACARQVEGLSQRGAQRSLEIGHQSIDVCYDVAPVIGGKWLAPDADWHKRAAFRDVTHPVYGTRRFIILTDITNNFLIYPTNADTDAEPNPFYASQAIKTNVPDKFVQRLKAPLPAWCRQSDTPARDVWANGTNAWDYMTKVPQYRWAFNSTATKACAVVYEDLPAFENPLYIERPFFTDGAGQKYPIQESLPGLVEMDIDITLTGADPEQFNAEVTVARELRASVTDKYILGADYAWPMPGQADIDELILMTGSIYHPSLKRGGRTSPLIFYDLFGSKMLIEVENFTTGALLRTFVVHKTTRAYTCRDSSGITFPAEDVRDGLGILQAADLRVLAFVVRQKYTRFAVRWSQGNSATSQPGIDLDGLCDVRIRTYMRNVLEDEIVMTPEGSEVAGELAAFFADESVAGLFKMPLTEQGDPAGSSAELGPHAYRTLRLLGTDTPYRNYLAPTTYPGPLVYAAAVYYSRHIVGRLHLHAHSQFAVHPNGSWSISTQPVCFYSGTPAAPLDSGSQDSLRNIADTFDSALMLSARVDIVSFRAAPTAEQRQADPHSLGTETRTTHLALLSKAMDKTMTAADFLPKWEKRTLIDTPVLRRVMLVDSVSGRLFELEQRYKTAGFPGWRYEGVDRPYEFDLHTKPILVWDAFGPSPDVTSVFDKTPVLGGSPIFL